MSSIAVLNRIVLVVTCVVVTSVVFIIRAEATTVITMNELKGKIERKEISDIYITYGGIEAIQTDPNGRVVDAFIVWGEYDKIPADIAKLAEKSGVNVLPSQKSEGRYGMSWAIIQLLLGVGYLSMVASMLVVVIIINRKMTEILRILSSAITSVVSEEARRNGA